MSGVVSRLYRAWKSHPPSLLAGKIMPRLAAEVWRVVRRWNYCLRELRRQEQDDLPGLGRGNLEWPQFNPVQIRNLTTLCDLFCQHRFAFFGSDWVCRNRSRPFLGEVVRSLRPAHRAFARRILAGVPFGYRPIDWQKDFRSGKCWDVSRHYSSFASAYQPGADVKQAWELARLQHLPLLALAGRLLPDRADMVRAEFRGQILDFIASNPPGMGIHWLSPLEIALRAANLVLAWEIHTNGIFLSPTEQSLASLLAASLRTHGRELAARLEYHRYANNHYLGNLTGLVFIASALAADDETDLWLAFADQELAREVRRQFRKDGGNFESSVPYHRFAGELVVYAIACLRGLPAARWEGLRRLGADARLERFRPGDEEDSLRPGRESWLLAERLLRAGHLTASLRGPDGKVPAFGDNDDGRCFFLNCDAEYPSASLQHDAWLSALSGLFEADLYPDERERFPLENCIVRFLRQNQPLTDPGVFQGDRLPCRMVWEILLPGGTAADEAGEWKVFPVTGLAVYRSRRLHLAVSALATGSEGFGNHSHNDKLSFTLNVDGQNWLDDPGTGGYTADPQLRNRLRSTRAHAAPWHGEEQNRFSTDAGALFHQRDDAECEILPAGEGLRLRLVFRQTVHERCFRILSDRIRIEDAANRPFLPRSFSPIVSPGYGRIVESRDRLAGRIRIVESHGTTYLDHID